MTLPGCGSKASEGQGGGRSKKGDRNRDASNVAVDPGATCYILFDLGDICACASNYLETSHLLAREGGVVYIARNILDTLCSYVPTDLRRVFVPLLSVMAGGGDFPRSPPRVRVFHIDSGFLSLLPFFRSAIFAVLTSTWSFMYRWLSLVHPHGSG